MRTSIKKPKASPEKSPPTSKRGTRATEAEVSPVASNNHGHDFSQIALQPKLTVNSPGDKFEQEANQVADQATIIEPGSKHATVSPLQTFSGQTRSALPSVGEAISRPGKPLDTGVRSEMEERLGFDFSRVRVHAGDGAERSARDLNAQAYTLGQDIVFNSDRYAPETEQGRHLLAHELTHVVQQSGIGGHGGAMPLQRQPAGAPAPAKAEDKPEGAAPAKPKSRAEEVSGEKGLSELRQQLFDLFAVFEKQVIGDAVFEKIETKKHWDEAKKAEAEKTKEYEEAKKKYDEAMRVYEQEKKAGKNPAKPPPPVPVAKFTTCIAAQQEILKEAFEAKGLSLKKQGKKSPGFAFATTGALTSETVAPGAWHWGHIGMDKPPLDKDRPRPGDIIVMAFRGGGVDEGAKQLNYLMNIKYGTGQKVKAVENAKVKLAASQEANESAQKALESLKANPDAKKWQLDAAEKALTRSIVRLNAAKQAAEDAAEALANAHVPTEEEKAPYIQKLEQAREKSAAAREERLTENPEGSKKRYLFQFSHVGFLQRREVLPDGREKWTTFDGGQLVQVEGQKDKVEGSQTSTRYYDPKANEISGEQQQGGEARWLYGWVDVDQIGEKKK